MKRVVKLGVLALLPSLAALPQNPSNAAESRDQGKAIFVSRCAKCHDADASRKLPDGTTLLGRLANSSDFKILLGTRLKNEQERDAVALYLRPLIDRWQEDAPRTSVAPQRRR